MRKVRAVVAAIAMVGAVATGAPATASASSLTPTPIGSPVTATVVTHQMQNGENITITTTTVSQRLRKPGAITGAHPNTLTCGQVPYGTVVFVKAWQSASVLGGAVKEKQIMGYYYDGCYVWQAPRWGWDNAGYHNCGQGYWTGVSYDNTECDPINHTGGKAQTGEMLFNDHWTDCAGWGALPDCTTFRMGEYMTKSGVIHG